MSKSILIVEDNRDDRLFITANLKGRPDLSVSCANDGAAAMIYLEKNPLPSVIILDLSLPKVSGLDVLKKLRADRKTKFIPVVVLSSSKEASDIQRAFEYGCNSYVYKPIVYEEFRAVINQITDYWCGQNIPLDFEGSDGGRSQREAD